MRTTYYTVIKDIEDIDSTHTAKITDQCRKVLSSLQKGESFEVRKFVKERVPKFSQSANARNIANMRYRYLREGKRIGILKEHDKEEKSISFEEFIRLDSVEYWISQISSTKFKNVKCNTYSMAFNQPMDTTCGHSTNGFRTRHFDAEQSDN